MDKITRVIITAMLLIGFLYAKEKRGWLGVYAHEPSEVVKIALNIEYGVIVDEVIKNSPAEKAGIQKGDIIMKINGEKIYDMEDLSYIVKRNPDKEVKIEILRKGKKKTIKVKLAAKEKTFYKKYRIEIPGCEDIEIPEFKYKIPERIKEMIKIMPYYNEEKIEKLKQEIEEIKKKLQELEEKIEKKY